MTHKLAPAALLAPALLALAACNTEPTTITANTTSPDPMADELANAAPIELPPALKETKTYRCGDNSLVYVDVFAGDMMANIRTEKNGTPTQVKAAEAGSPLTAEGYSLSGTGDAVNMTLPGKGSQSCKA